jgi:predicted nuclease of predicted toxin-antitoxin system
MSLRFYTDTHVPRQVAVQLRQYGVDVVRCEDVGLAEADDETHLEFAAREGRILVSFDKGFRTRAFEWLANGKNHAGIFLCKSNLQRERGIGIIVNTCHFYWETVEAAAATVDEFYNQVFDIE